MSIIDVIGITVLCVLLFLIIALLLRWVLTKHRRAFLAFLGLLERKPGPHHCIFCDLYDESYHVCLVIISHPKWQGTLKNRKTSWKDRCHWHKKGEQSIAQTLDIDKEKRDIEALLKMNDATVKTRKPTESE